MPGLTSRRAPTGNATKESWADALHPHRHSWQFPAGASGVESRRSPWQGKPRATFNIRRCMERDSLRGSFAEGGLPFQPPSLHLIQWNWATEKAHKLIQHKLFPPTQNPNFGGPRKKLMCLISWKRTQKRDPHKLFLGGFWGPKGVPNGPFRATKKFRLLFFFCPQKHLEYFAATQNGNGKVS